MRLLDVLRRRGPGASVPMTSTGGVSSGNVSTLIRGVTTPAKTTSAMQSIRTAIGLRSERPVTALRLSRGPCRGAAPSRARASAHAVAVQERAALGDDVRAGLRAPGRREHVAADLAQHGERARVATSPSTTKSVAFWSADRAPRRAGPPSRGTGSPTSMRDLAGRVDRDRACRRRRGRPRSARCACSGRRSARGARSRRRVSLPVASDVDASPACPAATTSKSLSGTSAVIRTVLRSTTRHDRRPRSDEGARIDRARRDLAVERRAQDAVARPRARARELRLLGEELRLLAPRSARVFCSASFGETKPPSRSAVHARRLVRRAPLAARRCARACIATAWPRRWRCGSRASRAPRPSSPPRPAARAPCRRTPRRTAGRCWPRSTARACPRTCASRGTATPSAATHGHRLRLGGQSDLVRLRLGVRDDEPPRAEHGEHARPDAERIGERALSARASRWVEGGPRRHGLHSGPFCDRAAECRPRARQLEHPERELDLGVWRALPRRRRARRRCRGRRGSGRRPGCSSRRAAVIRLLERGERVARDLHGTNARRMLATCSNLVCAISCRAPLLRARDALGARASPSDRRAATRRRPRRPSWARWAATRRRSATPPADGGRRPRGPRIVAGRRHIRAAARRSNRAASAPLGP